MGGYLTDLVNGLVQPESLTGLSGNFKTQADPIKVSEAAQSTFDEILFGADDILDPKNWSKPGR